MKYLDFIKELVEKKIPFELEYGIFGDDLRYEAFKFVLFPNSKELRTKVKFSPYANSGCIGDDDWCSIPNIIGQIIRKVKTSRKEAYEMNAYFMNRSDDVDSISRQE